MDDTRTRAASPTATAQVERLAVIAEGSWCMAHLVEPGECAFVEGERRGYLIMRSAGANPAGMAWPLTPRRMVRLAGELLWAAWRISRGRGVRFVRERDHG